MKELDSDRLLMEFADSHPGDVVNMLLDAARVLLVARMLATAFGIEGPTVQGLLSGLERMTRPVE
jgi:hypothetical protein